MYKGLKLGIVALIAFGMCGGLFGQEKRYNEAYNPVHLARRLSYENYRDLKLLQVAILNFGGGIDEVDRLINQYAEASALYFQNRHEESANLFSDNQREILAAAKRITTKYKDVADTLLKDGTSKTFKFEMTNSIKGIKVEYSPQEFLRRARFAVNSGNDYYDRFKDATTASPLNFVKAIYYYRRAKENLFELYKIIETDKGKKEEFLNQYRKDISDNENKVYQTKVKNP